MVSGEGGPRGSAAPVWGDWLAAALSFALHPRAAAIGLICVVLNSI